MTPSRNLSADIAQAVPRLRAFAISLAGNPDDGDDLVQETIVRALTAIERFEPGTNLHAWLFTILRNAFYSGLRKRRREVEDPDGLLSASLSVAPEQPGRLAVADLKNALAQLSYEQREALILVAAEGMTYDEVADVCGVAVGTVKSRVNRARARLTEILDEDGAHPPAEHGVHPCAA